MAGEKKEELDFGSLGIIIGIFFVVLTIFWIIRVSLYKEDNQNEITWVG